MSSRQYWCLDDSSSNNKANSSQGMIATQVNQRRLLADPWLEPSLQLLPDPTFAASVDQKFEDYAAAMFGHLSDIPWGALPTPSDAFATASSVPGGDVETSSSGSVPQDPASTQDTSGASTPLRVRCPLSWQCNGTTRQRVLTPNPRHSPAHYSSMQAHCSCIRVVKTSTPAGTAL